MDPVRKVLILHASAGHGHLKAARAVAEAFEPGKARVRVEDSLDFTPSFYGKAYSGLYLFLIRRVPWLWGLCYHALDFPWLVPPVRALRGLYNALWAARLSRLILSENPDAVISTHFLPSEVVARLKRSGSVRTRLVTVITDYLPHAFWINPGTDAYAVALPDTRDALVRAGVEPSRIAVTGIPIGRRFRGGLPAAEARRRLGLDERRMTALLTSGGAAVGSIGRIAERLCADAGGPQVLVVCGTNVALKARMDALAAAHPQLKAYGFVDNMHELMDAADLLVGKGGGLTLTEAMAKAKPMVLFEPVPGQESRNASVVERAGAAVWAPSIEAAISEVRALWADKPRLERLTAGARRVARPEAAEAVRDLALGG